MSGLVLIVVAVVVVLGLVVLQRVEFRSVFPRRRAPPDPSTGSRPKSTDDDPTP